MTPRIAVVGGGLGGAFLSSFLRNVTPTIPVHIDVYEASTRVGGRTLDSALQFGEARAVELGASMAIVQNRYVAEAAAALGLTTLLANKAPGRGGGRLAIVGHNGRGPHIAFHESSWGAVTLSKMAWRYGPRYLWRLRAQGAEFISNFTRLYDAQDAGRTFASARELLSAAHMADWPGRTCEVRAEGQIRRGVAT